MKKSCLLLVIFVFLVSCGTYNHTINGTKIKSVLAITQSGDTVAVPYREFVKYRDSDFQRYQYNNEFNWNRWQYPYFNNGFFIPNYNNFGNFNPSPRPLVRPRTQPRPRPRPRVVPQPRENPTPLPRPRISPPPRENPRPRFTPPSPPRRPIIRPQPKQNQTTVIKGRRNNQ